MRFITSLFIAPSNDTATSMIRFLGKLFAYIRQKQDEWIIVYLKSYFAKHAKQLGKDVHFNGISRITGLSAVTIEDNVHIGGGGFIKGEGGVFIGANTHISRNLTIYSRNHNYEGEALPYDNTFRDRPVHIGKNSWIGMNVTILPGAHIGDGAIIGAGAVVFGSIPAGTIMGAAAPKQIRTRDMDHYQHLENEGKYGGKGGVLI